MSDLSLLGICGSLRAASTNRLLMRDAARRFGDATYTEADIRLPLYDEDVEKGDGIPAAVQTLADQIAAADAILVVTPEYNKGISGALKNALDWVSRTDGTPWAEKPVALLSAAAGRAGGERAQSMARLCLVPFRPRIVPGPEVLIGQTFAAWDDEGQLKDERAQGLLDDLMGRLRRDAEWLQARSA